MSDQPNFWSEDNSRLYRLIAPVAVPARAEQIAVLLSLLPFEQDTAFHVVDVGAGEGILSRGSLPRKLTSRGIPTPDTRLDDAAKRTSPRSANTSGYATSLGDRVPAVLIVNSAAIRPAMPTVGTSTRASVLTHWPIGTRQDDPLGLRSVWLGR